MKVGLILTTHTEIHISVENEHRNWERSFGLLKIDIKKTSLLWLSVPRIKTDFYSDLMDVKFRDLLP